MKHTKTVTVRLLALPQAAEYLGVSYRTLYRMAIKGEIPSVRRENKGHARWMFDVRDLDQWIEHHRKNGVA